MDEDEIRTELERFFADPLALPREPLRPGARGDACFNIRLALEHLGHAGDLADTPLTDEFTHVLSTALKRAQIALNHTSKDGQCGPKTRRLLVNALRDHVAEQSREFDPFARMLDPERRNEGQAFVSYAREDRHYVDALVQFLAALGYQVWYDADMPGGEKFGETILPRIASAYLVLAVESPRAAKSNWVYREVEHADRCGVRILPVELQSIDVADPLAVLLSAHNRIGKAAIDLAAAEALAYRGKLRKAIREAHGQRQKRGTQ